MHSESIEVLKENIIVQVVETLTKKSAQMKTGVDELTKKLQVLEKSVQEEHNS
jgi:phage gp16-like protein